MESEVLRSMALTLTPKHDPVVMEWVVNGCHWRQNDRGLKVKDSRSRSAKHTGSKSERMRTSKI